MVDRKICLFSLAATFIAVVSMAPQTRALAITRVNVIDVVDGRIVPNSTVTIRGKTISSVAQNSAPPGDAQIVDCQGKFVIPGLWDMHAHMEMTESRRSSSTWRTASPGYETWALPWTSF